MSPKLKHSILNIQISKSHTSGVSQDPECDKQGGGQWRKMANNGEKWRIMAMANSAFSFVKFAIFRQFLILEFHI